VCISFFHAFLHGCSIFVVNPVLQEISFAGAETNFVADA